MSTKMSSCSDTSVLCYICSQIVDMYNQKYTDSTIGWTETIFCIVAACKTERVSLTQKRNRLRDQINHSSLFSQ